MAVIQKFLGQQVSVPEDRMYHPPQGLWVSQNDTVLTVGISQPTLVLIGGINDIDWLVEQNHHVEPGQSVIFAITGKILYLNTPCGGSITFNESLKKDVDLVLNSPYDRGWLFKVNPAASSEVRDQGLVDAHVYIHHLKGTDGFKNPDGLEGGVSGICKAVYSGIRDQQIN